MDIAELKMITGSYDIVLKKIRIDSYLNPKRKAFLNLYIHFYKFLRTHFYFFCSWSILSWKI